jgi:hypothetical protein
MSWIREFSQHHVTARERNVDNAAPDEMRGELVDFFFQLVNQSSGQLQPRAIYEATGLMLGAGITAHPYGGYPGRVLRDIRGADWWRVYDWVSRLWHEFDRVGLAGQFRDGVNVVLAAHGVVWELDGAGHWERILPEPLRHQVAAAIAVLANERFAPACELFNAATEAFNARRRRDRDACSNAFDALESVAKIVLNMANATFGQVLDEVRRRGTLNEDVQRLLRDVEVIRHNNFGHGMAGPFRLNGPEVDFVYTLCAAGILAFTRAFPMPA